MPDQSTILSLPHILPSQAQKHVTHNEALRLLDVIVQLTVTQRSLTAPPVSPVLGDRHIVATPPSGDWAGHGRDIALWNGTTWEFFNALAGWRAYVLDSAEMVVFDGANWVVQGGGGTEFSDAVFRLRDDGDATKQAGFELSGLTTGTTRSYALPDQNGTLALLSGAQTFTGDQTIASAAPNLTLNDTDAVLGGAAMARIMLRKGGVQAATVGYGGATDFVVSVVDGDATISSDVDDNEANSAVNFRVDGILVARAEPAATAVTGTSLLTGTKGDARYAQLGAVNTLTGTFTVSAAQASLVTSTDDATANIGTGATLATKTKTVNLGTDGAPGSTTVVNIGSVTAGALGTTVVNTPTVTFASSVTSVGMTQANLSANLLGLGGATADATNRLSVAAPGVLFNHAGTSVEQTLNKNAGADNARITFKTAFSTRAQFGLSGSDNFQLRVSPDGTTFHDGFTVAGATGSVTLSKPAILTGQASDPSSPADGTLWYNSTTGQMKARAGGETRLLDIQRSIPWLTPVSGDYVQTTMGSGTATTTAAGVAGRMDIFPFLPRGEVVLTGIAANCTTAVAAALGKFVIYEADANGRPAELLLETATVDLSATGVKVATAALTLREGRSYWLGLRSSSTAATSTWAANATPDINGGAPVTTARKVLRRGLVFATPAPGTWGFVSSEISNASAPAIWLRV